MPDPTPKDQRRAEKLSLLRGILGPEKMARLETAETHDTPPVDPDRVAWHRNRLLERLRAQRDQPAPQPQPHVAPKPAPATMDARLTGLADLDRIGDEHPAVIARLLRSMEREDRAATLRALPGPLARSLVRRMR